MSDHIAVYVSVGNPNDDLSQAQWARLVREMNLLLQSADGVGGVDLTGQWLSEPASAWQDACWALQLSSRVPVRKRIESLRSKLLNIADRYRVTIVWAEAPKVELIEGRGDADASSWA